MEAIDVFNECHKINTYLFDNKEEKAREELIKLLDKMEKHSLQKDSFVNHLIRSVGLYPYMNIETSMWQDKIAYEAFKMDTGKEEKEVLHREQSYLLKQLLEKKNIAVSAPTSFGKSFVIDAFIKIKNPKNVMIIVPTVALMDETRRRIYKKFSSDYQIITTTNVVLKEKNIFIFPQERASSYFDKIISLDLLVIDEFYKASIEIENSERTSCLIRVITKFSEKAKQKYFLAPNITKMISTELTEDIEFIPLNFNTVFLEKIEVYKKIKKNRLEDKKENFIKIMEENLNKKNIIYAGTYREIKKVSEILLKNENFKDTENILNKFSEWLKSNYSLEWDLVKLASHKIGIHNGRIHRCLSQIQIKLFQEKNGLNHLITTSSIMEGINTSAENIILWCNKNGKPKLNHFSYKNLIGRAGRMFKYFIGNIYLLEEPAEDKEEELTIDFPQDFLFLESDMKNYDQPKDYGDLNIFKQKIQNDLSISLDSLIKKNIIHTENKELLNNIIEKIKSDHFAGLTFLNSNNSNDWRSLLYKIIKINTKVRWGKHSTFVDFVINLGKYSEYDLPNLLQKLQLSVEEFFELEKTLCHNLAPLCSDINELYKLINKSSSKNIDSFVGKISHAFLPKNVYVLEEYGLPRMISKNIEEHEIIELSNNNIDIQEIIAQFKNNKSNIFALYDENDFEQYILDHFYDGIETYKEQAKS